jgi:hypothetical protein
MPYNFDYFAPHPLVVDEEAALTVSAGEGRLDFPAPGAWSGQRGALESSCGRVYSHEVRVSCSQMEGVDLRLSCV